MKCPHCTAWAFVKETRTRKDNSRRRVYLCANEHRFRTVERYEDKPVDDMRGSNTQKDHQWPQRQKSK